MNKRFFIFPILVVFLLSCETIITPTAVATATLLLPTYTPAPTPYPAELGFITATPVCVSPNPTQADIDRALSYTGQIFAASTWERTYTVTESRVAVTWQDAEHGAIAYLEALIFSCGYDEPDLNAYFSAQNWRTIFANYESYQPITECRTDKGLRLYQFKSQNQGSEYAISYWVQSDTDTRVIVTMIVFPVEEQALLGTYSAQLFPELPNCS